MSFCWQKTSKTWEQNEAVLDKSGFCFTLPHELEVHAALSWIHDRITARRLCFLHENCNIAVCQQPCIRFHFISDGRADIIISQRLQSLQFPQICWVIIYISTSWHSEISSINQQRLRYYFSSVSSSAVRAGADLSPHKGPSLVITSSMLRVLMVCVWGGGG